MHKQLSWHPHVNDAKWSLVIVPSWCWANWTSAGFEDWQCHSTRIPGALQSQSYILKSLQLHLTSMMHTSQYYFIKRTTVSKSEALHSMMITVFSAKKGERLLCFKHVCLLCIYLVSIHLPVNHLSFITSSIYNLSCIHLSICPFIISNLP